MIIRLAHSATSLYYVQSDRTIRRLYERNADRLCGKLDFVMEKSHTV